MKEIDNYIRVYYRLQGIPEVAYLFFDSLDSASVEQAATQLRGLRQDFNARAAIWKRHPKFPIPAIGDGFEDSRVVL